MPFAAQSSSTSRRVIPSRQNSPVDVQTSPPRTTKKCVELQVATNPRGSRISPSSPPFRRASMHAAMQLCFDRLLSRGSCAFVGGRITSTVTTCSPRSASAGSAVFHSGMITTVAADAAARGSWYGVTFSPRDTTSRTWTPDSMPFARTVRSSSAASSSRVRPTSIESAAAPCKSRSR